MIHKRNIIKTKKLILADLKDIKKALKKYERKCCNKTFNYVFEVIKIWLKKLDK